MMSIKGLLRKKELQKRKRRERRIKLRDRNIYSKIRKGKNTTQIKDLAIFKRNT